MDEYANNWEVAVTFISQQPSIYEVWDEVMKKHPAARSVIIKHLETFKIAKDLIKQDDSTAKE